MAKDAESTLKLNSQWVSVVSAVLVGWNVGLLMAFLMAIGLGVGLGNFMQIATGSFVFGLLVAVSTIMGILLGVWVIRILYPRFSHCRQWVGYLWLIALVVLSALSLPASFSFVFA
jgi:hypothetical protein